MTVQQVATGEAPRNISTPMAGLMAGVLPSTGRRRTPEARPGVAVQPAKTPQPSPALPSVLDLGRMMRTLANESERFDNLSLATSEADPLASREAQTAKDLVDDQRDSLRDLILTRPAQSLGDAAVQVQIGLEVIDWLENNKYDEYDTAAHMARLRRAFASVHPVIVAQAGITSAEIVDGSDWVDGHVARQFQSLVR